MHSKAIARGISDSIILVTKGSGNQYIYVVATKQTVYYAKFPINLNIETAAIIYNANTTT